MRRTDARLQHFSNLLAIGTGIAFTWAKYFAKSSDPYSNAPNAWEPLAHNAHVLLVPPLVYACGVIWNNHIVPKWRTLRLRRRDLGKTVSGLALLFVLIPMIATGYLIQISVDETWRKAWVAVHLATSAAWSISYLGHFVFSARGHSNLSAEAAPRTARPYLARFRPRSRLRAP